MGYNKPLFDFDLWSGVVYAAPERDEKERNRSSTSGQYALYIAHAFMLAAVFQIKAAQTSIPKEAESPVFLMPPMEGKDTSPAGIEYPRHSPNSCPI